MSFAKFNTNLDLSRGANLFAKPVSGGKYLPPGVHDVVIQGIGGHSDNAFKVVMKAGEQIATALVYWQAYNSNVPSYAFASLLNAIIVDNEEAKDWLEKIVKNPVALNAFVGQRLKIKWEQSDKGYILEKVGSNIKVLDAGSGDYKDIIETHFGDTVYPDFAAAREAVTNVNVNLPKEERLRPAFCSVTEFMSSSENTDEHVARFKAAITATTTTRTVSHNNAVTEAVGQLASGTVGTPTIRTVAGSGL